MDQLNLSNIISVLIFAITYLILQPLKVEIKNLSESIEKLSANSQQNSLSLSKLEESVNSAHKRIKELRDDVTDVKNRCNNCCNKRGDK